MIQGYVVRNRVWSRGRKVYKNDDRIRSDLYGRVMYMGDYGRRDSEHGWGLFYYGSAERPDGWPGSNGRDWEPLHWLSIDQVNDSFSL